MNADKLNMCACLLSLHLVYLVLMKQAGMLFLGAHLVWQRTKMNV